MCFLNFTPYDEDEPEYPLPRGRPRVAWVVPVDMCKLGASLQALTDMAPQADTLRLCHKFRDGTLSKLPQELLEQIIDEGTCLEEDHYNFYGEHVEKLWQKVIVDQDYGKIRKTDIGNKTETEKAEMVFEYVTGVPDIHRDEGTYSLHVDARFRWLTRACQCSDSDFDTTKKIGGFIPVQQILKSRFGLEAIIHHEMLSEEMFDFLPNSSDPEDHAYYTVCYLALPQTPVDTKPISNSGAASQNKDFESGLDHTVFRQVLDPSILSLSDKQRSRFARAMKKLNLKPHFHLGELEPLIAHPIQDEDLADFCSCRDVECPGACFDIHSWDRPSCLESTIERKSEELAKESWPKLMIVAASDTVITLD